MLSNNSVCFLVTLQRGKTSGHTVSFCPRRKRRLLSLALFSIKDIQLIRSIECAGEKKANLLIVKKKNVVGGGFFYRLRDDCKKREDLFFWINHGGG